MKRGRREYKKSLVLDSDPEEEDSTDDKNANMGDNCVSNQGSADVEKVLELTYNEEGRPMYNLREPERYEPTTGRSYAQIEACHNIVNQSGEPKITLDYTEEEVQVVANIITQPKAKCNAQQ